MVEGHKVGFGQIYWNGEDSGFYATACGLRKSLNGLVSWLTDWNREQKGGHAVS